MTRAGRGGNAFAKTRPEDVFGSLFFDGPPKSVEEMGQGFTEEPDAAE